VRKHPSVETLGQRRARVHQFVAERSKALVHRPDGLWVARISSAYEIANLQRLAAELLHFAFHLPALSNGA